MTSNNYLLKQYKFEHQGKANDKAVIQGEKYRFTILSNCFIRMEYSEKGEFEDRPSQIFWNRFQDLPEFIIKETDQTLEIHTDKVILSYVKEAAFSRATLMIKSMTNAIHGTGVYRYGCEELKNRGGTFRTLDEADGSIELDNGLFSWEGYTVIDDSKSLVFDEKGWFEKRPEEIIDIYYFGYGNDFKRGIKDFYKVSGNTPILPRYALGNWWSRYWEYSDEEMDCLIESFRNRNIPLSVCITDMDWHLTDIDEKYGTGWTGYTWNKDLFKNPEEYLKGLHDKGIKTALNLHPAMGVQGHEACYKEFATFMDLDVEREEYIPFDPIDPKFMKGYFEYAHHPHEEIGVDFWWIDWQQGNTTALEGVDPLFLLNHYHFMDHGRNTDKRPFIFSRWSGLGGHKYPIGFSGDTVSSWESLKFQPEFTSRAANVGYGWWSHDIGGHEARSENDELYARWVQYGVFSPIMRLHTTKNYYAKREPWRHGLESEMISTKYMQLRHEMIPYIYSVNKCHAEGGLPLITPLYYDYPKKEEAYNFKDQYTFGDQLMVAPFVDPMNPELKVSKKAVWFPGGKWYDFFSGDQFRGDRTALVYGDLTKIPVYAKEGAIIPMAELLKDETGLVKQGVELPETINIHVFPGQDNSFEMYEDDGVSNECRDGRFVTTRIDTKYSSINSQTDGNKNKLIKLDIKVTINGDISLLPKKRLINIALRSFGKPESVKCYLTNDSSEVAVDIKEDVSTKTWLLQSAVSLDSENKGYELTLILPEKFINDQFDAVEEIMKIVENSTYSGLDKVKLGYFYKDFQTLSGGVLGQDSNSLEKISRIVALDIPTELKTMAIAYLSRN